MKKLFFILPILLIACTVPKSPAQTIYAIEGSYAAALEVELAYSSLPACGGTIVICSDNAVIKKVQKVDDAAWVSIQAAQKAVRTQGFNDSNVIATVASAKALTEAFVQITNQLGVK